MSFFRAPGSFRGDNRGSVAVVFALTLIPMLGIVGGAIDAARWFSARRALSIAADTAVLAAARTMQINPSAGDSALTLAAQYYRSNLKSKVDLVDDTVSFVFADNNTAVSTSGAAYIDTSLLRMAGISKLKVSTPAKAIFQQGGLNGGSDLEIALSLDVTGSMCDDGSGPCTSGTKLTGLKDAAKDLVDIVLNKGAAGNTSRIALVPFSTRVRVGADGDGGTLMRALTNLPPTWSGYVEECTGGTYTSGSETSGTGTCTGVVSNYYSNLKIRPCVTDRYYDASSTFETSDATPGSGIWMNAHWGTRGPVSLDSSDTALTTGLGTSASDPNTFWNYTVGGDCEDVSQSNVIQPLTNSATDLTSRINALEAYGSTAGALATTMNYYMLSPKFSSVWPSASRPGSYSDLTSKKSSGAPVLRKVAVIMTDGDFNTFRGWKEQNQKVVSDAALAACTKMKADGIEIYTVGFALDQLSSAKRTIAEDTLRACGTDISHFYSSLTVSDLKKAFRDIALKVTPVRLTQ